MTKSKVTKMCFYRKSQILRALSAQAGFRKPRAPDGRSTSTSSGGALSNNVK